MKMLDLILEALAVLRLYPFKRQHTGYTAGSYYPVSGMVRHVAGTAPVAATLAAIPFMVPRSVTISELGARVTTAASGGKFQLAVYANDDATNRPTGNALGYTGGLSTTNLALVTGALNANVSLLPGRIYWLVLNCDATAGSSVLQVPDTATSIFGHLIGSSTASDINAGATSMACYLRSASTGIHAYNTWPDLTAVTLSKISTDTRYTTGVFKAA